MADKILHGYGREDAKIMIVTDYPTKEELLSGKICSGNTGRLIGTYLKDNGYDLDKCYKTTFIKREFHWVRAKKEQRVLMEDVRKEVEWGKTLGQEIVDINPNVIISCGELVTSYLTGRKPIGKVRGSVLPISDAIRIDYGKPEAIRTNIRVIPVYHPRDIHTNWTYNSYTTLDYAKAIKLMHRTDKVQENYLLWICRDAKSFVNWWEDRAKKGEFLTLDIETYMGHITCIGFSHDGYEAISVPLIDRKTTPVDRALILRQIFRILNSGIPLVNQNIKYDHHVLEQWGFNLKNIIGDTMLLGHTIYPELPKGLDFYTSIYTDVAYYKDDGRDFSPKEGWDTLFYYNAKDALTAWQIWKKQVQDAKEYNVWNFFQEKQWPLYTIYKKMDDRGIRIDTAERDVLLIKYDTMLQVRHEHLKNLVNEKNLNFNSPKQIAEIVYEKLGYPKQFKVNKETGKKGLTTDEETLEELILNHSKGEVYDDILWSILWCRKIFKIIGYVKTPLHPDGRMRTSSKLAGTKSGRTSMSETTDWIWYKNEKESLLYSKSDKIGKICSTPLGLSFQTIPKHGFEIGTEIIGKDIRRMYVPSPGFNFVEGDGGQAEARVVCILSDDEEALAEMNRKNFKRNKFGLKDDLHVKTAMLVLNKGFDEITELDRQDFGKKPRHAGNYDMGAVRLSLMAHIALVKAQTALTRFHSNNPKIRENFHYAIRSLITNKRLLVSPHGRQRQFFDKLSSDTFKEAYSYIPQAVVSDHNKIDTLPPLIAEFPDTAYFLSESHDSLLFEVQKDKTEEFCSRFKYWEEQPVLFKTGSFHSEIPLVIPLDLKTGEHNWYEIKEIKL